MQHRPRFDLEGRRASIAKVLLLILLGLGGCLLLCFAWIAYEMRDSEGSDDPIKINAVRDEIAKFDLPAGFSPAQYARFRRIRSVMYFNVATKAFLTLTEVGREAGEAPIDIRTYSEEQSKLEPGGNVLLDATRKNKQVKIKGQEWIFQFMEGADPQTHDKRVRVWGVFEGNSSPVQLFLEMDQATYKEDQVVKMLQGIR